MRSKWLSILGALALLSVLAPNTGQAQFNPNGWINTDGWTFCYPLLNPFGAGPPVGTMKEPWFAPEELSDPGFNPVGFSGAAFSQHRAGGDADDFPAIDFGGASPSTGWGGTALGAPNPLWYTRGFINAAFSITLPTGDLINYNDDFANFIDENFIDSDSNGDPAGDPHQIPDDNVVGYAVSYVDNTTAGALVVDVCTASDDSLQVWVNNKCILNKSIPRGSAGDCQERTPAILPPGVSRIIIGVWEGGGGHNFRLALEADGAKLSDTNGVVTFLGPNDGSLSGQQQYCVDRSAQPVGAGAEFNCTTEAEVTIQGTGPGDGGDALVVTECITANNPASITVSNVSDGGVVTDTVPEPPVLPDPLDPVGEFEDHRVVGGVPCGGASTTTFDKGTDSYTSVSNTGADIWDGNDVFEFAYTVVSGEFDISIRFDERTHDSTGRWGKFGLMARLTHDNTSAFAMIQDHLPDLQDPARLAGRVRGNHLSSGGMFEDSSGNDPDIGGPWHPTYIRLTRRGNVVNGWVSNNAAVETDPLDDANWTKVGRDYAFGGGDPFLLVGFANSEHGSDGCATLTARFTLLAFEQEGLVPPPSGRKITWDVSRGDLNGGLSYSLVADGTTRHVGTTTLGGSLHAVTGGATGVGFVNPSTGPIGPFDNSHDIGGPPSLGSTVDNGDGSITVSGSGADVWDGGDQMQFAYKVVTGQNWQATARVTDIQNPPNARWGRAGIMARQTCDGNSKYSLACVPYRGEAPDSNDTKRHQSRMVHGINGGSRDQQVLSAAASLSMHPYLGWVRLSRCGDYFFSEFAADVDGKPGDWVIAGGDTWQGGAPDSLLVGLIASSHNTGGSNQLVVTYDNWSLEEVEWPERECPDSEVIYQNDFEKDLGAEWEVVSTNFLPASVGGRLRITEDATGGTASGAYLDTSGAELGDAGFRASFDTFYNGGPPPADGFNFVVYETAFPTGGAVLGGAGGAAGFNAGDHNAIPAFRVASWSVELDNWNGGTGDNDRSGANSGPVEAYHLGINVTQETQSVQTTDETGVVLPPLFNTGAGLRLTVTYDPAAGPEGKPNIAQVTVQAEVIGGEGGGAGLGQVLQAYVPKLSGDVVLGFSGGTGGATADQEVDNLEIATVECATPPPGGGQRPGDYNQSGVTDLSDAVALLQHLFLGGTAPPCGDGTIGHPANVLLLDGNGSGGVPDLSDAVFLLQHLFLGGPPPAIGAVTDCVIIPDCPTICP